MERLISRGNFEEAKGLVLYIMLSTKMADTHKLASADQNCSIHHAEYQDGGFAQASVHCMGLVSEIFNSIRRDTRSGFSSIRRSSARSGLPQLSYTSRIFEFTKGHSLHMCPIGVGLKYGGRSKISQEHLWMPLLLLQSA